MKRKIVRFLIWLAYKISTEETTRYSIDKLIEDARESLQEIIDENAKYQEEELLNEWLDNSILEDINDEM